MDYKKALELKELIDYCVYDFNFDEIEINKDIFIKIIDWIDNYAKEVKE